MTDPKARELVKVFSDRQRAERGKAVSLATRIFMEEQVAAYGSSEYERGLRDGREQAAKITESQDTGANPEWDGALRHAAASIRQGGVEK